MFAIVAVNARYLIIISTNKHTNPDGISSLFEANVTEGHLPVALWDERTDR